MTSRKIDFTLTTRDANAVVVVRVTSILVIPVGVNLRHHNLYRSTFATVNLTFYLLGFMCCAYARRRKAVVLCKLHSLYLLQFVSGMNKNKYLVWQNESCAEACSRNLKKILRRRRMAPYRHHLFYRRSQQVLSLLSKKENHQLRNDTKLQQTLRHAGSALVAEISVGRIDTTPLCVALLAVLSSASHFAAKIQETKVT